jgi:predicted hotdog family 3-hydroxylacyl-ACP dehydratase
VALPIPLAFPLAVAGLLPHGPPMLMAEEVLAIDEATAAATVRLAVRPENPFVDDHGELDPAALVEIIAQAAAARHGALRRQAGVPPEEVRLLAVRQAAVEGLARVGDELRVEVQVVAAAPPAASVTGTVRCGDRCLAAATLTVWHGIAAPP